MRQIPFLEEDFDIPEAYENTTQKIKTGLPMTWVQREVGVLTTLLFSVHMPPMPDSTPEEKENGSKIERFFPSMWRQMERQQKKDIYRRFFDHMVADGVGVLKAYYKPSAWHGMPQLRGLEEGEINYTDEETAEYNRRLDKFARGKPIPFAVRVVDPMTVYPVWGEFGLDAVIEVSERPLKRVQRMAGPFGGLPLDGEQVKPSSTVSVIEYWDEEWMALLVSVGGAYKWVGAMKHGLRRIPYWIAFGEETSSTNPKYEGLSTLYKIKDVNSPINQMLTIKFNRAFLTGYPTYQSSGVTGDETDVEGGGPQPVKLEIGKINPIDNPDEQILPVPVPEFSSDIEEMVGLMLQLSAETQIGEEATGGDAFSGESGFLRAMRTEQARTGYHQIIAHAERELSDLMNWMLEMAERKNLRLWVLERKQKVNADRVDEEIGGWIPLLPGYADGYYNLEVKIEPYNPVMDVARGTYAANQKERGFWSSRFAHEFSGIGQPDEMEDEIVAEQIVLALQQEIIDAAIARLGFGGPAQQEGPALLGPDGQPISPAAIAEMGNLGGQPLGTPGIPGVGAPLAGRANGANIPIRP